MFFESVTSLTGQDQIFRAIGTKTLAGDFLYTSALHIPELLVEFVG